MVSARPRAALALESPEPAVHCGLADARVLLRLRPARPARPVRQALRGHRRRAARRPSSWAATCCRPACWPRLRGAADDDFVRGFLAGRLGRLRDGLWARATRRSSSILGNDDPRVEEDGDPRAGGRAASGSTCTAAAAAWAGFSVYGYACVPPTPFRLKDWERYDVSRYVDPGCVSPEEGLRTVPGARARRAARHDRRATSTRSPATPTWPARSSCSTRRRTRPPLDRAALDGRTVDHVPLDVHVGSIAVRRFIEARQPLVTLHGHVHESARLTGAWRERIGRTHAFSAAHDGPELALVRFDPGSPDDATRELLLTAAGLNSRRPRPAAARPPRSGRRPQRQRARRVGDGADLRRVAGSAARCPRR